MAIRAKLCNTARRDPSYSAGSNSAGASARFRCCGGGFQLDPPSDWMRRVACYLRLADAGHAHRWAAEWQIKA